MIEVKNKERSKIIKFNKLQNGDIFEYADGVCKNIFYMKTNNFYTNNGAIHNCVDIISGNFVFLEDSANVLKIKLVCEVEYL